MGGYGSGGYGVGGYGGSPSPSSNNPIGYNGRGSKLLALIGSGGGGYGGAGYGSGGYGEGGGAVYTPIAQLTRFEPSGSKQTFVDQTSLTSPGVFTVPMPVQVESGEFELEGVCNPQDAMGLQLGVWHGSLALVSWQVILPDGSTYTFNAYVSELVPFKVQINKYLRFSAKLRISGGMQSPAGAFDPAVFDPAVFGCGQI